MANLIGFQVGRVIDGELWSVHGDLHTSVENVASFEVFMLESASEMLTRIKPWECLIPITDEDIEGYTLINV